MKMPFILKTMVAPLVAGALTIGLATPAGAVTRPEQVSIAASSTVITEAQRAKAQSLAAQLRATGTATLTGAGGETITLRLDGTRLTVDAPTANSEVEGCATAAAITAAVFAIGAAAILTLVAAAIASGAAVLTIAGLTLTPGAWTAIAAAMGSWSAVYVIIAGYVC